MLARAFNITASFTAAEIALVEPIAAAVAVVHPATERVIRQSLGALAAALPAQDTGEAGARLKLNTYLTMLEGCDERALSHACRRCLDELDWMPTIHQLKDRMAGWVSPEAAAIGQARVILRTGRRVPDDEDAAPVDAAAVEALTARLAEASKTVARRVQPVAYSDPAPLEPHQLRIPNKGDYQRLFGIDPETERAKAEARRVADEEADQDLLADAYRLHLDLYGLAAA